MIEKTDIVQEELAPKHDEQQALAGMRWFAQLNEETKKLPNKAQNVAASV
jgi:hypothetical protein